jgi:hypothetical protein
LIWRQYPETLERDTQHVIAAPVSAIHVFRAASEDVDGRHDKAGHDDSGVTRVPLMVRIHSWPVADAPPHRVAFTKYPCEPRRGWY